MDKINDLKIIKKHFGENFAHLCRKLFPTILETPGLLSKIILEKFDPSRALYSAVIKDTNGFKRFIDSCAGIGNEIFAPNEEGLSPKELLSRAGYELYDECRTKEDLLSFKKYYAPGEELCSFEENRIKTSRVWFAVKRGAEKLNREDFVNPERQDEYGTSVISIQATKADGTISIKNRYNHKVDNPDATFGNNLDNIIPGLSNAFEETYHLRINKESVSQFSLPDYELGGDGRYYRAQARLNQEIYCENNIVLVSYGTVIKFNRSRCLLVDNYIIDFEERTIRPHFNFFSGEDSFVQSIGEIDTMTQTRNKKGERVIVIKPKDGDNVEITIDETNAIIGYSNPNVTEVGNNFMRANLALKELYMPKLKQTGFYFLSSNRVIKNVSLESLEEAGECFMENANSESVYLPKLKYAKGEFMKNNTTLRELSFPELEITGTDFFKNNLSLRRVYLPKVQDIEAGFMECNNSLTELSLPSALWLGPDFLKSNRVLKRLYVPNVSALTERLEKQFGKVVVREKRQETCEEEGQELLNV